MRLPLLLLVLLLLLGNSPAFAQINSPQVQADTLATAPLTAAQADTLAAIHRLFAHKRKRNKYCVLGTVGLIAVGGILIGTASPKFFDDDQTLVGGTIVIGGVLALLGEALTAYDYNRRNEQRTAEDFQAHKLSKYVRRKLKPKYFRQRS